MPIELEELSQHVLSRFYGKYRGLVRDVNDPTNRGRLSVTVPAVLHEEESWAMPCVPYAGDDIGSFLLPAVGSGVWVEFEGGDPSFPIWSGAFWADNQVPTTEAGATATAPLKLMKTEKGLQVSFNDDDNKLTISDLNGNNIITLDAAENTIRVAATMKIIIEAPKIELVEGSTHPLVFGDDLLTYLNQIVQTFNVHMHPGELAAGVLPVTPAPPVAPMAPPSPALLSLKVTTG